MIKYRLMDIFKQYSYVPKEWSENELEKLLGCIRSTLRIHLKKLIEKGVIEKVTYKKGKCMAFRGSKTRVFYRLVEVERE